MSFILDALRKAENKNRDRHNMTVPTSPRVLIENLPDAPVTRSPLIYLLLAGIVLLGGLWWFLHDPGSSTPAGNQTVATKAQTESGTAPVEARETPPPVQNNELAAERPNVQRETGARALDREAQRGLAPRRTVTASAPDPNTAASATPARRVTPGTVRILEPDGSLPDASSVTTPGTVAAETLPEYRTSQASAEVPIPQLHLDMHVFSTQPEKRFVFINLEKYVEGDAINSDTIVESIEPEGAVINHKGYRFVLRPD